MKPPRRANQDTRNALRALVEAAEKESARLAAQAEVLLRRIARFRPRIAERFYDMGEALRELRVRKLHVPLGFPSFDAMLKARGVMSAVQARKLVSIVRNLPREQALALGRERAYALVAYAAATPEPDTPAGLLEADAPIAGKQVTKASLRDLQTAVRTAVRASKGPGTTRSKGSRTASAKQRAGVGALRAALRDLGLGRCRVVVSGEDVLVTVPLAKLEGLQFRGTKRRSRDR